jgi:hypothetical protein
LDHIYFAGQPQGCLCSKFPIGEICVLTNKKNGKVTEVGNCCVEKFIGLESDIIFQGVKRVKDDNKKSLNKASIEFAFDKGWLTEWEHRFSLDTMRKRRMSDRQMAVRVRINEKVLARAR